MNIGSLSASLLFDVSSAMSSMTKFEQIMVTLVNRIDSQLEAMSGGMLKVGASATVMGNQAVAAAEKVAAATELARKKLYVPPAITQSTSPFSQSEIRNVISERTSLISAQGETMTKSDVNNIIRQKNSELSKITSDRNKMIRAANAEADRLMKEYNANQSKTLTARNQMIRAANAEADRLMKQYRDNQAKQTVLSNQSAIKEQKRIFSLDSSPALTSLNNFEKQLQAVSQKFRTFGYLASVAITAPLVMASKSMFNLAKDFEFTMQKIAGLTSANQQMTDEWQASILKLAPALGKSPKELAEAMYFIASSAFTGAKGMDVLELSTKAAVSGLGEAKDISMFLTSALNAYAGTGLTAAQATDILIAAVREGKAEADAFTNSIGSIIPIASEMGVSLDQVAGGMAAITLTGSTAAQAATYLKGIFNSLAKGPEELGRGAEALHVMNSSYSELRGILRDQGLLPLMQKLRDMQAEYGETLASKVFPNIRALSGFLSIAGKNFEYNTEAMKRVTSSAGSLGRAFAAVSDTIKFRYDKALANAQVGMINMGKVIAEAVLPLLEKWGQKINNLGRHFEALSDIQKRHKINWILFLAALGPASLLISLVGYSISGLIAIFVGFGKTIMYVVNLVRAYNGSMVAYAAATRTSAVATNLLLMGTGALTVALSALATAVVFLGAVMVILIRRHNEFKRMQRDVIGQTAEEIVVMKGLFDRASTAANGTKMRVDAIKTINEKYGEYLHNMLTEKSSLKDIADAYNLATQAMMANMQLKAGTDLLQKKMERTAKVFGKELGGVSEVIAQQKPDMLAKFYTDLYAVADKAVASGKGKVDQRVLVSGINKVYDVYLKDLAKTKVEGLKMTAELASGMNLLAHARAEELPVTRYVNALTSAANLAAYSIKTAKTELEQLEIPTKLPAQMSNALNLIDQIKGSLNFTPTVQIPFKIPIDQFTKGILNLKDVIEETDEVAKKFSNATGYKWNINPQVDAIIRDLKLEESAISRSEAQAKKFGFTITSQQDRVSLYAKAIEALNALGVKDTSPEFIYVAKALKVAQDAMEGTRKTAKELKDEMKGFDEIRNLFDDLNASLAAIQLRKFIDPSFDTTTAELEIRKKAYEDYAGLLGKQINPKTFATTLGSPLNNVAALTSLSILRMFYDEYQKLLKIQEDAQDTRNLKFLQAQANAFGGIDNQIELVNGKLQLNERLMKKEGEEHGLSDRFLELAKNTAQWRNELERLQNIKQITFLTDMNNALKTSSSYTELLSARIDELRKTMELLSAKKQGGSEYFKQLANQLKQLSTQQKIIEELKDSFSNLFYNIMQGTQSVGKSIKQFANDILSSFEKILAQNLAEKLVNSIIPKGGGKSGGGGWLGFLGKLLGLVGMVIPGGAAIKAATTVGSLGGIVPQGFPGDTYPALLTSGETVLPKGLNNVTQLQFEPVEFVIKENQLVGILRKANTRKQLT